MEIYRAQNVQGCKRDPPYTGSGYRMFQDGATGYPVNQILINISGRGTFLLLISSVTVHVSLASFSISIINSVRFSSVSIPNFLRSR